MENIIWNLTKNWNTGVNLGNAEAAKLRTIIDDLAESKAIDSREVEDFLRFTLFIVFDEYDKNKDSLRKFYHLNYEKYAKYRADEN